MRRRWRKRTSENGMLVMLMVTVRVDSADEKEEEYDEEEEEEEDEEEAFCWVHDVDKGVPHDERRVSGWPP